MDKTRYCNSKIYFDDLYNPCLYVFWRGRNVWPTWFKYVLLHSKLFNAHPHCNELWVIQYVHFGEICTPSGLIWKSACQTDSYGSLHAKQTHMEVCMPSRWFIGRPLNPPTKSNTARAGRANLWAAEQGSAASTQTSWQRWRRYWRGC